MHGFLTLLDLLGHHLADAHEALGDGAGCLGQALLGGFPKSHKEKEDKCQQKPRSKQVSCSNETPFFTDQMSNYALNDQSVPARECRDHHLADWKNINWAAF